MAASPPPSTSSTASVDGLNIRYVIPFASKPTWTRVYIDTDRTPASGYPNSGIGAEYLIENGRLFRYSGSNGGWGWTSVKAVSSNVGAASATVSVAIADLGSPPSIDSVTQTDPPTKISPKITTATGTTTPPPPPTTPPPSTATVWVDYFGDSTAHGDIGNTPYQVARPPSVVMDENLPSNYNVRNEAVGGASVAELLAGRDGVHAPWATTVARSNARYILMNYSINDSYETGTTTASYKASYAQVIDIARAAGKTVILQTTNPTNNSQKDVAFSTAMKEIAAQKNVPVIDVYAYLSQYMAANNLGPYQITNDGIHPNQATYILVGEYTARRFKEIVGIR
jgi:lysophospholipase L1-like esterase